MRNKTTLILTEKQKQEIREKKEIILEKGPNYIKDYNNLWQISRKYNGRIQKSLFFSFIKKGIIKATNEQIEEAKKDFYFWLYIKDFVEKDIFFEKMAGN